MYSPKISEELIPDLYKIAKAKGVPMTKLANDIISDAIREIKVEVQVVREEIPREVFVIADKPIEKEEP